MKNALDLTAQFSISGDQLWKATANALDELARILEDDAKNISYELPVPIQPATKFYEGILERLHVVKGEGALKIYHDSSVLLISGSLENCSILAANLRFSRQEAALSQPLMQSVLHIHIEYFPDHFYLDPISDPVVIYIKTS